MKTKIVTATFTPRPWWRGKWFLLTLTLVLIVGAAVGTEIHMHDVKRDAKVAQAEQTALRSSLNTAIFSTQNDTQIIQDATKLIDGAKSGRYKMSQADLAQFYLDRANAYTSNNDIKAALADYNTAVATDSGTKIAALQAELSIQSQQGNTKALVPILQQLVPLLRNSSMPMAGGQATQYQNDIQAIQSGQEVSF